MKRELAAVVAAFIVAYLLPLGYRPLSAPDEIRYAEVAREMLAGGEWIVPHLNGVRYFEKPVLGYWLIAASMMVFGENAWAARLPAALATALAAFVVYRLVASVLGCRVTGLGAAVLHITCIEVFVIGTASLLDATFTGLLTAALGTFWFACREPDGARRIALLAGFGALCGCATLVKGFLGLVVPVIVIGPFLAWQRRWRDLLALPWIPAAAALAVMLPWAVAVAVREPDFWAYFFWEEHVRRFVGAGALQNPEPWWYFGVVVLGGALPWPLRWPAAVAGLRQSDAARPFLWFCVCWLVAPLLLFSASSGKLMTYVLPCFPPLAMLAAVGLRERFTRCRGRRFEYFVAGLAGGALLFVLVDTQLGEVWPIFFPESESWRPWLLACGLVPCLALTVAAMRATSAPRRLLLTALAPVGIFAAGHFLVPYKLLKPSQAPVAALRADADVVDEQTLLVADPYLFHAVCWVFKRDDVHLLGDAGELRYGLDADEQAAWRLHVGPDDVRSLLDRETPERRVVVFARIMHLLETSAPSETRGGDGLWILAYE